MSAKHPNHALKTDTHSVLTSIMYASAIVMAVVYERDVRDSLKFATGCCILQCNAAREGGGAGEKPAEAAGARDSRGAQQRGSFRAAAPGVCGE